MDRLWARWAAAMTVAEVIGFGFAGLAAFAAASWGGERAVLLVVPLVGAAEGALVGLAQAWAVRPALPRLPRGGWVALTAVGAGLAWLMGTMVGDAVGDGLIPASAAPFTFAVLLVAMGAGLGALQAVELHVHLRGSGWWVLGNAIAWAVGLVPTFLAAGAVGEGTPVLLAAGLVGLGGLAMGLIVGLVTGATMQWLLRRPLPARRARREATA